MSIIFLGDEMMVVQEQEEFRKIQQTGRGSYIISLPKKWVESTGLKAGDPLSMRIQRETLLISTQGAEKLEEEKTKDKMEATVTVSETNRLPTVIRKIKSIYATGHEIIRIISKNGDLTLEQRGRIHEAVRKKFIGTEVIEESPGEITLQVLVRHPEISILNATKRTYILALMMHRDAILALKSLDTSLAQNVIDTDDEVDRFDLYVVRQLKDAIQGNRMIEESGLTSPREFLGYRIVTNSIEGVADCAVKMAKETLAMKSTFDDEIYHALLKLSTEVSKIFEDSMMALLKKDYQLADDAISRTEDITDLEHDILNLALTKGTSPEPISSLVSITNNLKNATEYSKDIAEVTLNRSIIGEKHT